MNLTCSSVGSGNVDKYGSYGGFLRGQERPTQDRSLWWQSLDKYWLNKSIRHLLLLIPSGDGGFGDILWWATGGGRNVVRKRSLRCPSFQLFA